VLTARKRLRECSSVAGTLLFVFAFYLVSPGQARDWIVNPESGADTNDGSANAPLATAQAAVDKSGPGDHVILQPAGAVYRHSIDLSRAPTGLVLNGNGVILDGGGEREHGVVARGNNRNVKVFNLSARNFTGEGFLIGGNSRGFQCFGVSASENGVAGFAVADEAECWIRGGRFERNPLGFVSRNSAESYHIECRFDGPVSFAGGRHSLSQSHLVMAPDRDPILSIEGTSAVASLVIQSLVLEGDDGGKKPGLSIGPGSFVYHDAASKDALAKLDIKVHPSSEVSESLYHTYPIGRDASGTPIMAWAGGGTRYLPSNAYRIIHFGKHVPQEVAPKLSPDNDWLGLLAPLDTTAFPPAGPAFAPEHSSAHAIWRWIGLAAPDAVFVPDTPEGRALGEALRNHPPAGVGMIDVFINRQSADGAQESVVLPRAENDLPMAKTEMLERVSRAPDQLLDQIASAYGDGFAGSYIEALAVIARAEGGLKHRAAELARAHLEKNPGLPKNGGEIAGTLLYASIDEDWAKARVVAVADMAFEEGDKPLEAMPAHNEMSDAIFMAGPVLAHAGRITGEARYFDQALRNYRFIAGLCRRPDGIYRHSPLDEAAWGRGNGFPALGLALTLQQFPEGHEGYAEMRDALVAHLTALAPHQDSDGMWHQVIDHPDSYAELTATAMIAYAIATALEKDWLEDRGEWESRLDAAWSSAKMYVANDGRTFVNVCTGTGKQPTLEDYYRREAILGPDGRGAAMMMMLAAKLKALGTR
jgi:unsaturated rhamnogalacturonyl hydrolase